MYHQLLQRIAMLSDKPVFYLRGDKIHDCIDDWELRKDKENHISLSVDFDF